MPALVGIVVEPSLSRVTKPAAARVLIFGGFGYGVSYDGAMVGGFGFAIMDVSGQSEIAGGFGGFISGLRLIDSPINLSIVSWTALGGLSTGIYQVDGYKGYFALLQEVTLEVGFPIIPWFMPTVYAGYQVAAFTVNQKRRARELIACEVDCLITDAPDRIASVFAPPDGEEDPASAVRQAGR